jgi:hypothetical protein
MAVDNRIYTNLGDVWIMPGRKLALMIHWMCKSRLNLRIVLLS